MTIQFPCTGCDNQLSVPDTAVGKKARCPKCSAVIEVPTAPPADDGFAGINTGGEYEMRPPEKPAPSDSGYTPAPMTQRPAPYSDNPYASPSMGYDEPTTIKGGKTPFRPTQIQFENVFSEAWNLYLNNWGIVLGAVLIVGIVNFGGSQILNIVTSIVSEESEEAGIVLAIFGQIVLGIFNTFLHIGQTKIMLDIARGRPGDLADLVGGGRWLLWGVLGWIAYILMMYIGLLLLIVPGIFVALIFGQFLYLMIDQDMGFGDAFSTSVTLSNGNKGTLFVVYLVGFLITFAAVIACVLPVIFFGPFVALLYVVAYVKMTGGKIG